MIMRAQPKTLENSMPRPGPLFPNMLHQVVAPPFTLPKELTQPSKKLRRLGDALSSARAHRP